MERRSFLKQGGLVVGGVIGSTSFLKGFATPFVADYPLHNIPVNKGLDAKWIKSLYETGKASSYCKTKNELKYIGMPAGGLHSGTLYMGGDGRLWLWGIYNDDREGVDPKEVYWNDGAKERKIRPRDGANYVEPTLANNKRVLDQGIAVKITYGGVTVIKQLNEDDWDDVIFEATYPLATVRYVDKKLPIEVVLKGGAFFVPLNTDYSELPATFQDIEIKNISSSNVEIVIAGWLENGANKITAKPGDGTRRNEVKLQAGYSSILSSFVASKEDANTQRDAGTMSFSVMNQKSMVNTSANPFPVKEAFFSESKQDAAEKDVDEKLVGSISVPGTIAPGKTFSASFVIAWHFNHSLKKLNGRMPESKDGYYYATRFKDAGEVMAYVAKNFKTIHDNTLLWQKTFYDSTLPKWFLERTFLNIGTIATANTYRFASGRFWGWEGVNACEGTCTHVWQYGHTLGRMFPSLERDTRQRVDLGVGMQQDGGILFRGEFEERPAIDGQAGTILRIYREHQMCPDSSFLTDNWTKIKKAVTFMLQQDKNGDGLTDTPMENTLDAVWEGEIAWIAGLCIAAAKAAQMMAEEMNDTSFAGTCKDYVTKGGKNMNELFNGEYFIHRPDAKAGRKKLGSYNTCHIDQVYGQSWAFQVGLGRLWDKEKTLSALRSLWKYNFAPDVGPYIKTHTGGRPYALAGEAGLIMNTNPHNEPKAYGEDVSWQLGYFHECMSGFEHQVAAHMMAEGMTDEALVLTKSIHDRYHAAKRNPYNEIECSDHYARAMASYGTFITACGFEYHGPKGYIRFAPAFNAANFKTPFTAAQGWGTYEQFVGGGTQKHSFNIKYGEVALQTISVQKKDASPLAKVSVFFGSQKLPATFRQSGKDLIIELSNKITLQTNQTLAVVI